MWLLCIVVYVRARTSSGRSNSAKSSGCKPGALGN